MNPRKGVEAKNCAAHSAGAKYVIRGNGVVRIKECSESLCISLLALMAPITRTVFDRIASGQDPKDICEYIHCPDVGVECGGFGKAVLKVTVE